MANQLPGQRGARRREVVVHVHGGQFVVVEAGAAHRLAVQAKSQRLHQVQLTTGVGREPNQVAGVRRNLRLEDDDVEHAPFSSAV